MSTSNNSLGFARVAATVVAAMITSAMIAVAVLVLTEASADGAQNVSDSEAIPASGVADAKPAPGFVNAIDSIVNKPPPRFVHAIHPIVVGDFGHKDYRHDRDHDRRRGGDQRAEEVRGGKDTSRPPGAPEVTPQGTVDRPGRDFGR
jgi:hypothetical protein